MKGEAQLTIIGGALLGLWGALRWFRRRRVEFGAWAYGAALRNPQAYLTEAKRIGLTHIDVMANDASADVTKGPIGFHLATSVDAIRAAVRLWQANGLTVSLTTWACPRQDWVDGMRTLGALAGELGIAITLDLEEPWVVPLRSRPAAEVQQWTAALFGALRSGGARKVAVTCIVYADLGVLTPALQACDVIIPQSYATKNNTQRLAPGQLEQIAVQRFTPFGKTIVLGAAAWNLEGAYGLGALDAARASVRSALALGVPRLRYWHLDLLGGTLLAAIKAELAGVL